MDAMTRFERQLQMIQQDQQRGAAQLARMGIEALLAWVQASQQLEDRQFLAGVEGALTHLIRLRPTMAPIANWAKAFERRFNQVLKTATQVEQPALALQICRDILAEQASMLEKQIEAARPLLAPFDCLMTLSFSSTVEALLLEAAPTARLIISESRPLYEGRRLAQTFQKLGRSVTLITEAQIPTFIRRTDAVLLGADTIGADLAVINKVGTYLLCLLAKQANVPLFIAADTYKFRPDARGEEIDCEAQDGAQIWPEHPELCVNIVFEPTPASLIDRFITEKGALTPVEMRKTVCKRG